MLCAPTLCSFRLCDLMIVWEICRLEVLGLHESMRNQLHLHPILNYTSDTPDPRTPLSVFFCAHPSNCRWLSTFELPPSLNHLKGWQRMGALTMLHDLGGVCACAVVCVVPSGVCHFLVYISFVFFAKGQLRMSTCPSVPGSVHSGDFARPLFSNCH